MSALRKEKRKVYARKIRMFWEEFRQNRIGFVGLTIILIYLIMGVAAPYLTPYRPDSPEYKPARLAGRFAMPQWVTIFPQFADLPPTIRMSLLDMDVINKTDSVKVQWQDGEPVFDFNISGRGTGEVLLGLTFDYPYVAPKDFRVNILYSAEQVNSTTYTFEAILKNTTSNEQWENYLEDPTQAVIGYWTGSIPKKTGIGVQSAGQQIVMRRLFSWKYPNEPVKWLTLNTARILFSKKSEYNLQLKITFKSRAPHKGSTCKIHLRRKAVAGESKFTIWGSVHGILGTNQFGYDVWTALIYGINISFIVGVLAAVISTTLGITYGVTSGYLGGILDTMMMRTVDILLCLPVLPILLIMITWFQPSVYHVVVLIAIFGWQGLSRIIRSRVLSLREMPFVESARAAGGSSFYVMTKHLIPNVIPVAMASLILSVPGAILTEAALSFLGFGDPRVATWGRMLYRAQNEGAFPALAWWYIIPPGLAITFLCVAFVFIGYALDQIVNPRLRRRR